MNEFQVMMCLESQCQVFSAPERHDVGLISGLGGFFAFNRNAIRKKKNACDRFYHRH
jgi:hypothetical protein